MKYATTREVADALNVTPSGISRMVARGALKPAMRAGAGPGGAFLFRRRDIDRILKERAKRTAATDSK